MKLTRRPSAFTLIELLVVITIIGILITITVPAINGALDSARMTATLANARSLQIATSAMSFDSLQSSDPGALDWTSKQSTSGSSGSQGASLAAYFDALTNGGAYLSSGELKKLLTAPGKNPQSGTPGKDNIAFNFYEVSSNSPSEQVFVATQNWSRTGLDAQKTPYGKKGFVYYTKGGGGGVKKNPKDAVSTNDFPTAIDGVNLNYKSLD